MARDVMLLNHPDIQASDLFSADLQTPQKPIRRDRWIRRLAYTASI